LYAQDFESAVKLCSKLDDDFKHWLRLPVPLNLLGAHSADSEINIINVFDCLSYEVDMLHSQVLMFVEGSWNVKVLDVEEPRLLLFYCRRTYRAFVVSVTAGMSTMLEYKTFCARPAPTIKLTNATKGR
ncbi:hypothetical protein ACTXNX_26160, partial [Pseudomonas helleri]